MGNDNFFEIEQYSLKKEVKQKLLFDRLLLLHKLHLNSSADYRHISEQLFPEPINSIADIPYLPVSVFKNHQLKSIPDSEVFKVLTSSGTTGTVPSRIFLDKNTANMQTKALSNIMQYQLGKDRLPMILVDSISIIKDRSSYSARGAGILGMSVFGKSHFYLLDENMNVDQTGLKVFLRKFKDQSILLFGFTFMVWQYLYESSIEADLSKATLIHSGGWKKMLEKSVNNNTFKKNLKDKFGMEKVFSFYGMVEQVGSVFLECECGHLHAPNFADIIVRDPFDFSVVGNGKEGIIQVLSILPESYPGHSLLTEDTGVIIGEDDCRCGRNGKYFSVTGRMKKAELRGCSDTFVNA
jgi:phenylacetate-coenzyme A ligase PaaK-like adenylate-forming protein